MADVIDINTSGWRNTREIVKAMQMVSAAKLRRAQMRALAGRPYTRTLTKVLKSLVSRVDASDPDKCHPLLERREEKTVLLIVVSSERGLAGTFNSDVLRAALLFMESKRSKNIDIIALGRKACEFFRLRYPVQEPCETQKGLVQLVGEFTGPLEQVRYSNASTISGLVIQLYTERHVDSVYILYNEFKPVVARRFVLDKVLPIPATAEQVDAMFEKATTGSAITPVDYIYELWPWVLLSDLVPRYVSIQIYQAMLESEAALHAARITIAGSATVNAPDMIDALTLAINCAPPEISKEIIEIVSGAAEE